MRGRTLLTVLVVGAVALVPAAPASAHGKTNGLIVFAANATGSYQLYTVRPDGTRLTRITDLTGQDATNPDWSPDGRRLVFATSSEAGTAIAMSRSDGSDLTLLPPLAPAGGAVDQPSFSADGRSIFYERWDGISDDAIFTASATGARPTRVTDPPDGYGDIDPNVSPDGRTLSFVRLGPNVTDAALFTIDLRTGREKQLTPYDYDVAAKQGWSPDGRRLVFSRDYWETKPGISGNVVTVNRSGKDLRNVTTYSGGDVHGVTGSYSPDGCWIVFREAHADRFPLMMIHPDGTGARVILEVPGLAPRYIDWGPGTR